MKIEPGASVGAYEILSLLGKGGMGEVWRARDTRLDREVAIKVLPAEFSRDPERVQRFEREAKLLASLNHPNIAQIYGFESEGNTRFLVLEFVEGETLAARLKRGPLATDEAIEVCGQVAMALETAHERGVVHRDLKPGNVMVTPDGAVKVLDFGLARAMSDDAGTSGILADSPTMTAHSPTITQNFTRPGMILGTAAYMSPEQARGRPVDKRTDIWSFGVILYESLTGDTLFAGETVTDSIGAILHKEVDFDIPPATRSPSLRRVLSRCLVRDRKHRLRDIGDARIELESGVEPVAAPTPARSRGVLPWGAALLLLLVGGIIGTIVGMRRAPSPPPLRVAHVSIEPPRDTRLRYSGDVGGPAAVSPNGEMVAFTANRDGERPRLWVRRFDKPAARELKGSDGATFPFWSPDNSEIGFFTIDKLRRIDLESGTLRNVCDVSEGRGGSWTTDGRIILSPSFRGPLVIVSADGGTPQSLTVLDEEKHTTHRWPFALPDGNRFLFFAGHRSRTHMPETQGIYIGYLDGREPRQLLETEYGAAYVDDHVLFVRDNVLLASRVDLDEAKLIGNMTVIARDVAADLSTWNPQFSASGVGVLAFNRLVNSGSRATLSQELGSFEFEGDTIIAYTRSGRPATRYADGVPHADFSLSPDGKSIAVAVPSQDGSQDLWLYPTAWFDSTLNDEEFAERMQAIMQPSPRRFTFVDGSELYPVWSPNSDELAFARTDAATGVPGIYRKRIGGGADTLLLSAEAVPAYPTDWTQDGKYIIYTRGTWQADNENDIWALPLDGGEPFPLVQGALLDGDGAVSPDGRWLAYFTRETSTLNVFVVPFAPAWEEDRRNRRWQISMDGGRTPKWSHDGKSLFFVTRTGMLSEVPVAASTEEFEFGGAQPLFQSPFEIGSSYDVFPTTGDGSNIAFAFDDTRQSENAPISVILNWQRLLDDGGGQ